MSASLNRLAKWRAVFAGWQLGTRATGNAECNAVRDHREATLLHRAELNTLLRLLIEKKVFTASEFRFALDHEADQLSADLAKRFPGFKATDAGIEMNAAIARDTMQGWRP